MLGMFPLASAPIAGEAAPATGVAAVSGVAATAAVGSVSVPVSATVSVVAATAAVGSVAVSASATVSVSGVSGTAAVGSLRQFSRQPPRFPEYTLPGMWGL